jgi:hypothetical protein
MFLRKCPLSIILLAATALMQPGVAAEKRSYRYLERTGAESIRIERTIETTADRIRLRYDEGGGPGTPETVVVLTGE